MRLLLVGERQLGVAVGYGEIPGGRSSMDWCRAEEGHWSVTATGFTGTGEGLRQSCLAHLIRKAKGSAERKKEGIANFGRKVASELKRLCEMLRGSPTVGCYRAWYARFNHFVARHIHR